MEGPRNVPDDPKARQPPTPSHGNGFFPKENAPRGLKGARETRTASVLSWEKAPHAVSNDTAPLGAVFLGKKLPIFFLKAQNWTAQPLRELRALGAHGKVGGFLQQLSPQAAQGPFLLEDKGLDLWEGAAIDAAPSDLH